MSQSLCELICGRPQGETLVSASLQHLAGTLLLLLRELPPPFGEGEKYSSLYSPFLARSLLEVSLTALVARVDPFRLLTIAGSQSLSGYEAGEANSLAFRWQGDVLVEQDAKKPWAQNVKPKEVSRALLGDYQDQLFWQAAFTRFSDMANQLSGPRDWTAELLRYTDKQFVPYARSKASRLFSATSKGIHHEFVIPVSSYYDEPFLKDLVEETVFVVSSLAVVANFCEYLCFRLPEEEALQIYQEMQS